MGKRSRKRSSRPPAQASQPPKAKPRPPRAPSRMEARYERSEERNEEVRAALMPLEEGERPWPVTGAAIYAVVLAVAQVVAFILGDGLDESRSAYVGPALFIVVMLVAAWGCWRMRYWAVLGMQALFALTILYFMTTAATRASSVVDVLIVVVFVVPAAVLFWHLVKQMARIQMPQRPTR